MHHPPCITRPPPPAPRAGLSRLFFVLPRLGLHSTLPDTVA